MGDMSFHIASMDNGLSVDIGADALRQVLDDKAVKMTFREREIVGQGWRLLKAKEAMTELEWAQKCEQDKRTWTLPDQTHVSQTFLSYLPDRLTCDRTDEKRRALVHVSKQIPRSSCICVTRTGRAYGGAGVGEPTRSRCRDFRRAAAYTTAISAGD